ncbi:MAG: prepilin-type N-terminal cleavage/methylation domain-containing protein [Azonexus sp.]|nr:prepilin-type N-terminal cleavage/methylation domain-containing protein [Azonexus sp.]
MNPAKGFTLVELLVAISVLAIVAVLGWRGLDTIIRARSAITAELEETRGLQLAFAQMQHDAGQLATPAVLGQRPALAAAANRLMLVRFVFAENQPSRLQVVAWAVADGKLTRSESLPTRDLAALDAAWQTQASGAVAAVTLSASVSAMQVRVWRQKTGWVPADGAAATVDGLEIALQLREQSGTLVKVFLPGAA